MAAKRKSKASKKSAYQRKTQRISRWRNFKRGMRQFFRRSYYATLAFVVLGSVGVGWWWVQSGKMEAMIDGMQQSALDKTAGAGLSLEYIYLEGRKKTPMTEVSDALGLQAGDPILSVSVDEVKQRLLKLGWVADAVVERQLPDTIHIHIYERQPIAIWQYQGFLRLVDEDGAIIEQANAEDPEYRNLMLVVGEDAPAHTADLLRMLSAEPELFNQVTAAVRRPGRRWDLKFATGVEVKLPANNPERAWTMLAEMDRQQHVLNRDIRSVDLRLEDRIFIDLPPDARHVLWGMDSKET